MISKKLADLEIAILEKSYKKALALLVEVFAAVVAMGADAPLPFIQWVPKKHPGIKRTGKRSDNDYIIDAIKIAALASNRVPESTGQTVCPKCGGQLTWNIHQNGHVWGTCETRGCLSFME